jgi:hypothetical protein
VAVEIFRPNYDCESVNRTEDCEAGFDSGGSSLRRYVVHYPGYTRYA